MLSKFKFHKLQLLLRKFGHLEFLRFGVRDRIIRLFHNPDEATAAKFLVKFYGLKYPGDFDCFIDWSVFYYGAYAKNELTMLGQLIKASHGESILDIGGNVGHHSLFFSTFGKNVHAFEPFAAVYKKLEEKIRVNNTKNMILHKIALGEKNEVRTFYPSSSNNTGTGSFINENSIAKPTDFRIFNGDEYLTAKRINNICLIKIDVEGFEVPVLKGLKHTVEKERPIVFFEWSQGNFSPKNDFFPQNYDFFIFYHAQPKHFFLSDQNPKLVRLKNSFSEGNLVAIPKEIQFDLKFKTIA